MLESFRHIYQHVYGAVSTCMIPLGGEGVQDKMNLTWENHSTSKETKTLATIFSI